MSKETLYKGGQRPWSASSQVTADGSDGNVKHGWTILVLLECINVILSSRLENVDHSLDYEIQRAYLSKTTLCMSMGLIKSILMTQQENHGMHIPDINAK